MRVRISAFAAAAVLLVAPAAVAAPTCLDTNAQTIRCGVAGAMPVGWVPPPGQDLRAPPGPPAPGSAMLAAVACLVASLFALIALMPDFDGSRPGDWDAQEEDGD